MMHQNIQNAVSHLFNLYHLSSKGTHEASESKLVLVTEAVHIIIIF